MRRMRRWKIWCVVLLASGLVFVGCDDDDEEQPGEQDTGVVTDTGDVPDTAPGDTAVTDTAPNDTGAQDTGAQDTGAQDTGAQDTGAQDTGAQDTGAQDTGAQDTVMADTVDGGGGEVAPMTCTANLDNQCPASTAVCGITSSGDDGCVFEGKTNCYDTGSKSLKVTGSATLTFSPPIDAINVFFAAEGANTSGNMVFKDGQGSQVDAISTNGNCSQSMPSRQSKTFSTPVATAEVTATNGTVWVDTITTTR